MSGEDQRIIIRRDGKAYGPYTREDAKRYLNSGLLLHGDLARPEGQDTWRDLTAVLGMEAPPSSPTTAAVKPSPPVHGGLLASVVALGAIGVLVFLLAVVAGIFPHVAGSDDIALTEAVSVSAGNKNVALNAGLPIEVKSIDADAQTASFTYHRARLFRAEDYTFTLPWTKTNLAEQIQRDKSRIEEQKAALGEAQRHQATARSEAMAKLQKEFNARMVGAIWQDFREDTGSYWGNRALGEGVYDAMQKAAEIRNAPDSEDVQKARSSLDTLLGHFQEKYAMSYEDGIKLLDAIPPLQLATSPSASSVPQLSANAALDQSKQEEEQHQREAEEQVLQQQTSEQQAARARTRQEEQAREDNLRREEEARQAEAERQQVEQEKQEQERREQAKREQDARLAQAQRERVEQENKRWDDLVAVARKCLSDYQNANTYAQRMDVLMRMDDVRATPGFPPSGESDPRYQEIVQIANVIVDAAARGMAPLSLKLPSQNSPQPPTANGEGKPRREKVYEGLPANP